MFKVFEAFLIDPSVVSIRGHSARIVATKTVPLG